jgi:hypothetical protein
VRELLHTIAAKTYACEIITFLKFLESVIKDFNLTSNMGMIMKMVLAKVPKPRLSAQGDAH